MVQSILVFTTSRWIGESPWPEAAHDLPTKNWVLPTEKVDSYRVFRAKRTPSLHVNFQCSLRNVPMAIPLQYKDLPEINCSMHDFGGSIPVRPLHRCLSLDQD